jgi:hypothetical protein
MIAKLHLSNLRNSGKRGNFDASVEDEAGIVSGS